MSDLLKSNLALENPHLKQRVHAAVIQVSHQQKDAEGPTGAFANLVLANLTRQWEDFILDVATNPSVIDVLVLADDHNTVTSVQVGDQDILYIVNGTFTTAANKYAPGGDETP